MKNHTEKKEAVWATFKAYRNNLIDKYELKAYLEDIQHQLYKVEFENMFSPLHQPQCSNVNDNRIGAF